jgi:transcriptional regulator with XRE-family HTH domain
MADPISVAAKIMGDRIRAQRQKLGVSQETLADLSGLHWTFVGQVERGRRNVSLHNIIKLAGGLAIDPAELVRGLMPEQTPTPESRPTQADIIREAREMAS